MSQLIKKGKLFKNIFYPANLQRSYELHRDLKSSITLRQADQIYQENQEVLMGEEKTAFLQFLNNFPLGYNSRQMDGPLNLYFEVLKMQTKNLSIYEQQLKLSTLSNLKQFLIKNDKVTMLKQIKKTQMEMTQSLSENPYDSVHAFTYMMAQKNSTESDIFKHSINAINKSNQNILLAVLPKIAPALITRLTIAEWSTLRRFKYLLNFVHYQWIPGQQFQFNNQVLLMFNVASWQLHLIGFKSVSICVDKLFQKVGKMIRDKKQINLTSLSIIFQMFDFLPRNYQPQLFKMIKEAIMEKLKVKQSVFQLEKLPYNRLSRQEVEQIYKVQINRNIILDIMLFGGHKMKIRNRLKQNHHLQILYTQLMKINTVSTKNLSILLIAASLFYEKHGQKQEKMTQIVQKIRYLGNVLQKNQGFIKNIKFFSLSNILSLVFLDQKYHFQWDVEIFFNKFMAMQAQFILPGRLETILDAIRIHWNSQSAKVCQSINIILYRCAQQNPTFNFMYFTQFIFLLEGKPSYQKTINVFYDKLEPEDYPYFIQLYHRYAYKSQKLTKLILNKLTKKNRTFACLGKFLTIQNNQHLIDHEETLIQSLSKSLEQCQITIKELDNFMYLQIVSILKNCDYFFSQIPRFTKKIFSLSMDYLEKINLKKQGVKPILKMLEIIISYSKKTQFQNISKDRLIQLIDKTKLSFSDSAQMKIQQLEFKWLLGIKINEEQSQLLIKDIMIDLLQKSYENCSDTMMTILKLNAFGAIQLELNLEKKIASILNTKIKSGKTNFNTISNSLYLLPNQQFKNQEQKNGQFVSTIRTTLNMSTLNTFSVCIPFVKLARLTRSRQLIEALLRNLPSLSNRGQFIKVHDLIYCSFCMDLSQSLGNISRSVLQFNKRVSAYLPDLTYIIHYHIFEVSKQDQKAFKTVKQLAMNQIFKNITDPQQKQRQNMLLIVDVLKLLWVKIKIGEFDKQTEKLYDFLISKSHRIAQISYKTHFFGLVWQDIWEILAVMKKKYSKGDFQHSSAKISKNTISSENQRSICQNLSRLNLKKMNSENIQLNSNNYYTLNSIEQGIQIAVKIKKEGKVYGLLLVDESNQISTRNNLMGRVLFRKSVLQYLTGMNIIPVRVGHLIKLQ